MDKILKKYIIVYGCGNGGAICEVSATDHEDAVARCKLNQRSIKKIYLVTEMYTPATTWSKTSL